MIIKKKLNNNAVVCLDDKGEEIIVKGKGLAYGCSNGDELPAEKIEKLFVLKTAESRNRYQQLLLSTPDDVVEACEVMIEQIQQLLKKELSDQIYITLTDHVCNLIERTRLGIIFDHGLLWDVKRLYREEYEAAKPLVQMIRDNFHIKVDEEEAGFIALHIVNAELNTDIRDMAAITTMIEDIYDIVESDFDLTVDPESLEYTRFIMHLRVFLKRIITQQNLTAEKSEALINNLIAEYPKQYACVLKILDFISMKYDEPLEGEILYLLVHVIKLTD